MRHFGATIAAGLIAACGCASNDESGGGGAENGASGGATATGGAATGGTSGTSASGTGAGGTSGASQGGAAPGGAAPGGAAPGGSGGAGTSGAAGSGSGGRTECGGLVCDPVILPGDYPPIGACCAGNAVCGLDGTRFEEYGVSFDDACQPRDQPGEEDDECPSSTPAVTDFGMLDFPGCCKPEGTCGYLVNDAFNLVEFGLGCVLPEGGAPTSCTPG